MKIGDEVYVHGFVDEIRKDIIIVRNDGGYFGTVPSEITTADRKDEPQTDCIKVGKWYSFTDYVVEMQGVNKPKVFRIVPQTERSE